MDSRLADLLLESGIATPEQAEKLRDLIEEQHSADFAPLVEHARADAAEVRSQVGRRWWRRAVRG